MAVHRFHPDPEAGDPGYAILYDDCPRCAEHAANPLAGLDSEHLGMLWTEMVRVERDRTYKDHYRTGTEGDACRQLYRVAIFLRRNTDIDPWTWPLTERRVAV